MRITVDTRKDSKEDIRKVIAVLSTFLDRRSSGQDNDYPQLSVPSSSVVGSSGASGGSSSAAQQDASSIFSIFDNSNIPAAQKQSAGSVEEDEEIPEGTPEIELY